MRINKIYNNDCKEWDALNYLSCCHPVTLSRVTCHMKKTWENMPLKYTSLNYPNVVLFLLYQSNWLVVMEYFNEDEIKVEDKDIVVCEECSQEFFSEQSLSQHKKKKHDKRQFTCSDCGEIVVGMRRFHEHKRKHENFDCTICGQSVSVKHKVPECIFFKTPI